MIRIFVAAGIALVVSLVGTRLLIRLLTKLELGQPIHEDVPEGHTTKAGTPTMGGLAIVVALVISYVVSCWLRGIYTTRGILVVLAIAGAGLVGLVDDWIKVRDERNLGLGKNAKLLGLSAVAITFAVVLVTQTQQHTELSFTRWDSVGWQLGKWAWAVAAVLLILGSSNAVNLTDGLDGLAAGSAIFAFSAFVVIGFWSYRNRDIYDLVQGLDLAVIAAAMVGGCAGFLWWNAAPARIIMGDTGSLAIGTALACLALTMNTILLLGVIGALFVAETLSVIIQVASFRTTGRRVFRMAPIHHHFELLGWPETTVVIRFWMLSAIFTAAGIGLYYYDYLDVTGTLSR
ncbi:MAG TPA: phospho-N-acetylmuramoyl-pentapeptide-transferase [Microthrixaceae bacterium]|nr:phospho-N-acetylmuramoyl-pentapeptide-transferase [Microthrixaceae bacterium]